MLSIALDSRSESRGASATVASRSVRGRASVQINQPPARLRTNAADYARFAPGTDAYLARYSIDHYNPRGDHFNARR